MPIRILTVAETGSTNADLLDLARTGAEDGLWLRADRQTAGRGRQGKAWESPTGNFHASTLVRLRDHDPSPATLALVAAVALEETIGGLVDPAKLRLKWPNDLLLGGAKVSGILLERVGDAVVIGIGVNLAHHPDLPDRRTTSLASHGATITPHDFAIRFADMVRAWLHHWRTGGLAPIVARWTARAHPAGTALVANLPDGSSVHGGFDGLATDGALVLRLADGSARVIHAADVFLV